MSLEDERRRSILLAGATALTGGLAGCTGLLEESGENENTPTEGEDETATTESTPTATEEPVELPVSGEATRIEYGASVSGELTASAPSNTDFNGRYEPYTFRGSEGDVVQITMTSPGGDPYLFLLDESGTVLAENDDNSMSLNSTISGFELPEDGGYVVLAGSFSDIVGFEYELSLNQVESDLRSIAVGETRTGVLDTSDPQSSQFNGYHEPVTLDAETGATVSIEMTSATGDTYLYLLDPNDQVVAQNDDFNSLNSFIPSVTLSESGEYTIIATSFSPEATFTYELSVGEVARDGSRSISVGETLTGELSTDDPSISGFNGHYDPITLDAAPGTTVDIEMTSDGDTFLYLLDPDGDVVAQNDDTSSSLNSRIARFSLGQGEYTIIATSFSPEATFSYELSVTESASLPDLRSIDFGETGTGGIDSSDPREDRFNGYYEPVTFDGSAGQFADIEMTSETGDTYLYLLDPSGQVVAENDDTSTSLNSRIEYELESDGEYTIIATSFSSSATFEYQLSLTEGSAPVDLRSIDIGETRTGELDTSDPQSAAFNGYYEPVTLSVDGSTTVDIEMTSDGDTYLYLLDPNDQLIGENDDYDGLDSAIVGATLPEAGDYTIIATSFSSSATFEYQLSVSQA